MLGGQESPSLVVMLGPSGTRDACPGAAATEINPQITCVSAKSVGDARPPGTALRTEHFDLTADDSQDECLADGMRGCEVTCSYRAATPHRVKIGCSARRWPVLRRRTCGARTPLKSSRRTGLQRGGSCKPWVVASASLWSGPTTSKRKEAPWKSGDLSTGRDGDL